MQAQVHVIHVSKHNFQDSKTGNFIKGCKVTYLGDKQEEPNGKGLPALTVSAPYELWDKFGQLPGNYNVDLQQRAASGGAKLYIVDANFAPKAG